VGSIGSAYYKESQRKILTPKSKQDCSCWDSNLSLGCTTRDTVLHRIIIRIYGVYTPPYNTYRFLIRKIRYVDTPPPSPVLYGVYTVPYNTYNITNTVLANLTYTASHVCVCVYVCVCVCVVLA